MLVHGGLPIPRRLTMTQRGDGQADGGLRLGARLADEGVNFAEAVEQGWGGSAGGSGPHFGGSRERRPSR